MNTILARGTEVIWTEARLSRFTLKEIAKLASAGMKAANLGEKLQAFVEEYPPTAVDIEAAMDYHALLKSGGGIKIGTYEVQAMVDQCDVTASAKKIVIETSGGSPVVLDNAPFPVPPQIQKKPYMQAITAIAVVVADVRQGVPSLIVAKSEWMDKWSQAGSPIKATGPERVLDAMTEVLHENPQWPEIERNKTTFRGPQFVQLWLDSLGHCSLDTYFALHFTIIADMLKTHHYKTERSGLTTRGKQYMVKGKPIIDVSASVAEMPQTGLSEPLMKAAQRFKKAVGLWPMFYVGDVRTASLTWTSDGTFDYAVGVMKTTNAFRTGDSGLGGLVKNLGFSGYTSNEWRQLSLMVGATLHYIQQDAEVVLQVDSVGHLPFLRSSFERWQTLLGYKDRKWSFSVNVGDRANIPQDEAPYVSVVVPASAHFVWISDTQLPSEGDTKAVLEKSGQIGQAITAKRYTVWTTLWGAYPWKSGHFVKKYGCPFDFKGFVTTDKNFSLWGTDDRTALKAMPLTEIRTEEEWYHMVVKANECVMSYFLKPMTLYSPLSNVVFAPRTGVKMRYQEDTGTLEYSVPVREHVDFARVEEPGSESERDGEDASSSATGASDGDDSDPDEDGDEDDHPVTVEIGKIVRGSQPQGKKKAVVAKPAVTAGKGDPPTTTKSVVGESPDESKKAATFANPTMSEFLV